MPDIVVCGAGHNSLITACYLAKAGYDVLVLESRPVAGGGAVTEELSTPGFKFDSCSTGHTLIQPNPVLRDDELGLKGEFGLEYVQPDPIAHVVFPDGEHFTHWLDLDRTLDEIARFSQRDADAYKRALDEFAEIRGPLGQYRFNPIGYAPPLDELLRDKPRWLRRIAMTLVRRRHADYEDPHVQAYILWQAFQTAQPVDSPGSGLLAYSIVAGRQSSSWTLPLGGSGELARALVDCLQAHGGELRCGTRVAELVVENGRCVGVVTERRRADRRGPRRRLDDPREEARRDGAGRCLGRRLPLRRRDVRRGHLDVRAVLRDDRGAGIRRRPDGGVRRRRRLAATRSCRRAATCAPAVSCVGAGCSLRRRPSSTRRVRPRAGTP